ncbi:MAG: hypothetical protein JW982_10760 [Spirochaetes bacterium]|nr:hypothetical protein [Spirochaetota bacterium]
MERQVLHINVAHFQASLEEIRRPELRGEPFAIASPSGRRSVLLDVSNKAFSEGIDRGDSLKKSSALKRLRILHPDFNYYLRAEKDIYSLLLPQAPAVETVSRGHFFLDVTGTSKIFGSPIDHAVRIKRIISEKIGITPIVALASNRLVSKIATRVVKPVGFISVLNGDEQDFLAHQDVTLLPGIGEKLTATMKMLGIRELMDLATLSDDNIYSAFGRKGFKLRDCAKGIDFTAVCSNSAEGKNFFAVKILDSDSNDLEELSSHLYYMAEDTGFELRKNSFLAKKIILRIYYTDGIENSGRSDLLVHSAVDRDIYDTVYSILIRIFTRRVRIRKMILEVSHLMPGDRQMDLFVPEGSVKNLSIQKSIDSIRMKFGRDAIQSGFSFSGGRK